MNLFGKAKKGPTVPQPSGGGGGGGGTSDAIGKLRDASETLDKRQEHLMRKIDNEVKMARDFSQKSKKREALTCIKRKKMYEKQLEQITGAQMTLETQRMALEMQNINMAALEAQRAGAQAMQAATRRMGGVDAVEETMDQIEEGLADADEIGQAMSRTVNAGLDMDDDELLAELESLETDDLTDQLTDLSGLGAPAAKAPAMSQEEAELAALNASMDFPSAPKSQPAARAMTEEEKELAALEASMAM
jgi:charged multivesicular body protein 4